MSAAPETHPMGQAGPSAFDAHHPPSHQLMDQCVHCGFCLPICPTYVMWRDEMDSPRGRIYLMKMAADGAATLNDKWVGHLDACLGCMACMTACPSGVDYGKLIESTRAQIERNYERPRAERLFRRMILSTFTDPKRLRAMLLPLKIYQKTGLRALARNTGLLKLLPKRLRSMESLLPDLGAAVELAEVTPAQGQRRHRVGMLTGCVQSVFFPQVNAATARVLAAEGCEVVAPREQSCCGALPVHAGAEEQALELARRTIDTFERAQVDTIIINAAGCGSSMKEYGYLLRDDPQYATRAKAFAAKCKDVSEFLAGLEPRATRNPMRLRVAYHDSCHLQHAQGVRVQPRALLGRIPQLELLEIPEAAICCGSAGIYNLVQPEAAEELGDRKAGNVASQNPDVVVSGNPGCLLQLRTALERAGKSVPVMHTVELLDASIRGSGVPGRGK
jgi:glycolate oxidase iron-sulfur subunit